jgi:hypothetical protein
MKSQEIVGFCPNFSFLAGEEVSYLNGKGLFAKKGS